MKEKKRNWHKSNKPTVYSFFCGVCQVCNHEIDPADKWDIHHLSYNYKNSVYDYAAQELIDNGIITLVCRRCHNDLHSVKDPLDVQPLENRYTCDICKKSERGIIDRRRYESLNQYLCRQCYLNHRHGIVQLNLF